MGGIPRFGDWIQTYKGRMFWPLDPLACEVWIDDVAHSLSMMCRFGGHCQKFYSVAEHSVRASLAVPTEHALRALLHDAHEAYVVDLPRPLKRRGRFAEQYLGIENACASVVAERFGLEEDPAGKAAVKDADDRLLVTEMRDLMAPPPMPWLESGIVPYPERIVPVGPKEAEQMFLDRFRLLGGTHLLDRDLIDQDPLVDLLR